MACPTVTYNIVMNERLVITHRIAGGFIETANENFYVRIDEDAEDVAIIFEEVVDRHKAIKLSYDKLTSFAFKNMFDYLNTRSECDLSDSNVVFDYNMTTLQKGGILKYNSDNKFIQN